MKILVNKNKIIQKCNNLIEDYNKKWEEKDNKKIREEINHLCRPYKKYIFFGKYIYPFKNLSEEELRILAINRLSKKITGQHWRCYTGAMWVAIAEDMVDGAKLTETKFLELNTKPEIELLQMLNNDS